MRLPVITITILLCTISICFSQTNAITGKVVDKITGSPVERALVSVKRAGDNRVIAFSQTSKDGTFEIKKTFEPTGCIVEVSSMGYATQSKELLSYDGASLLFEMIEKAIELKEVIASAPKIRQSRDTTSYSVSAFAVESDRTIGDVLKKMPGIEVSETGAIKYQGQDINKFYVEGSDLLGGRYGIATNNISHKDVASVEVMENHQPVKALEDIAISTQPAINLKLKEDAKTRWAGTLKIGGGIPELWNIEAFAMRFMKKVQSMNTYKGSNTGSMLNDANLLIPDIDISLNTINLPSYINVRPSVTGGIGSYRNRFETKHNITSNNLVKVGKVYDLLPEIIMSRNKRDSEYKSSTTYFLDGEELAVEEKNETTRAIEKSLGGKILLRGNEERFYFNNTVNFNLNWNETDMGISGTYPNKQAAGITYKKLNNNLDFIKRIGRKTVTIQSLNEYASKPQSLIITKSGETPIHQDIDISSFHSNSSIKYGFGISKFFIDLEGRVLYQNRNIENTFNEAKNASRAEKLNMSLNTSIQYKTELFHTSLSLPVFYQYLSVTGKYGKIPGINPRFNFSWTGSPKTSFAISGSYRMELPDENLFYTGNILSNYRIMNSGYINFDTGDSYSTSASIRYKNVMKLFFADATVILSKTIRRKISNQDFINDYILNGYFPAHIENENIIINGSISKDINWLYGIIAFYPMWSAGKRVMMRNEIKLPYYNQLYALRGVINSKVVKWCNMNYNFSYMYNTFRIENQGINSYDQLSQSLNIDFFLLKQLQLKYTFEHYRNEQNEGVYKNFVFSDITMSYLLGTRWEFSCFVKNIFDEKRYSYFNESELVSNKHDYRIRGRDIILNVTYRF